MLKIFVGLIFLWGEVFCSDWQTVFRKVTRIRVDLRRQYMFLNSKFDYIVKSTKKEDDFIFEWGRADEFDNQHSITGVLTMEFTTSKQNTSIEFSICKMYDIDDRKNWAQAIFNKIYHDFEYSWYEKIELNFCSTLCPFKKYSPVTSPARISLETASYVDFSECNKKITVDMILYFKDRNGTSDTLSECKYQGALRCAEPKQHPFEVAYTFLSDVHME